MNPLCLDIPEALAALRAGSLTPAALLEAALERIGRLDGAINAFVRLDDAAARARAQAPAAGPLAGLPLAHKDMFLRAGMVSTFGSRGFAHTVATTTATVLARLDAAGALDLGTLHMAELAHSSTGHNAFLGPVHNPWHTDHIVGGSSSGPAAAVAARMVFAALGSDTGGSIRMPAHFTGITGLKPTQGLVSRAGTMPLSFSLDTIGPMARSAAAVAAVLQEIAGPDPRDPTAEDHPLPDYAAAVDAPVDGRVIGVPERFYLDDLSPGVAAALEAAITGFERLGVAVRRVRLPDQAPLSAGQLVLVASEALSQHRDKILAEPDGFEPQIRNRLLNGFGYSAQDYLAAARGRGAALAAHLAATEEVDAVLTPVVAFEAPRLEDTDVGGGPLAEALIRRMSRLMRPANYLGVPALAFPAGFGAGGLPVGLQLVGRPFDEMALLALVGAFQRASEHHLAAPPIG
ncbi:amidase [Acuticoccus mangrovi]|uniref:Indoleacetamide hydrolase n=1 Tax=Acuticoccus mangrovi TaxID=2796142 RepID=A0A934MGN2_9HYPH|nr:amidase [Acuticoccus mangrovi]